MDSAALTDFEPDGQWFVLHTRSRQEKALAQDLDSLEVLSYLPLIRQVRYYGRRKFQVEEPLFPGYVFVCGSLEQAYLADRTKRVANIIQVADQARLTWELKNLSRALTQNAPLDPYPFLKIGTRVEVKSGPFRGLQGLVENRLGCDRLILEVDMLGRAVSLEMHGAILEPLT
jgi:transcription antitermination factor NusG